MKYQIVNCDKVEELNEKVNKEISKGWRPLGGVAIGLSESEDYAFFTIAQAMIME